MDSKGRPLMGQPADYAFPNMGRIYTWPDGVAAWAKGVDKYEPWELAPTLFQTVLAGSQKDLQRLRDLNPDLPHLAVGMLLSYKP